MQTPPSAPQEAQISFAVVTCLDWDEDGIFCRSGAADVIEHGPWPSLVAGSKFRHRVLSFGTYPAAGLAHVSVSIVRNERNILNNLSAPFARGSSDTSRYGLAG